MTRERCSCGIRPASTDCNLAVPRDCKAGARADGSNRVHAGRARCHDGGGPEAALGPGAPAAPLGPVTFQERLV
jgi:hypothetical protein